MRRHNTTIYILHGLLCGCLALFLSGCAAQVASHEEAVASIKGEAVEKNVPKSFAAKAETGTVDDGWLKSFHDPVLDQLVAEALTKNPGLKIAEAKVDQAKGLIRQAESRLKPSVGLGGTYKDNDYKGNREKSSAALTISWEADVWGRIRTGVAGEKEAAAATVADFLFARQSLAASVANAWFMATTAKLQHQFTEKIVKLQEESLKVSEAKQKIGQGTERDVHLARASLASAREAARSALAAHEDSLRSLELLLGRYPSADLKAADRLVAVPPPIPAGIPSEILERRPDLVAAEHAVAKAFYKEKEANLLHLPRFNFSLGIGINSLNNAISGLAAGLFAPLYTGGAIEAEVEKATAEQKAAIAAYAQKALQAFKEVESALAAEEHLARREGFMKTVVAENSTAYRQTRKQYEIGQIPLLDVLTVQEKWIGSQIAELDISDRRLINRINLHLALGGSFEETPAIMSQNAPK
jgi:NodT family efflux transporter outer membrane factor (OMF) lipoprotein